MYIDYINALDPHTFHANPGPDPTIFRYVDPDPDPDLGYKVTFVQKTNKKLF